MNPLPIAALPRMPAGAIVTLPSRAAGAAETSGNPRFEGGLADPEGIGFDHEYWIDPTDSVSNR